MLIVCFLRRAAGTAAGCPDGTRADMLRIGHTLSGGEPVFSPYL